VEKSLTEKRKYTRIPSRVPIDYKITHSRRYGKSITLDVSEEGIRAVFDNFVTPSTLICLDLNLATSVINIYGEVVWSQRMAHSDRYTAGIKFIQISPVDRLRLREYIMTDR